jgi:hypothetical protein
MASFSRQFRGFYPVSISVALLCANVARAQAEPVKPLDKPAEPAPVVEEIKHEAQLNMTGFFSAGNVPSVSGKAAGYYQLRAFNHGVRVEAGAGATGLAQDVDKNPGNGFETPLERNVSTIATGKLRYDFFFLEDNTAYASFFGFHDSAANLGFRLRAEVGYRRYLFNKPKHTLSAELGAVYTADYAPMDGDSNNDGVVNTSDRMRFDDGGGSAGARLMVQYVNAVTDTLAFSQTAEVIPNFWPSLEAPYEVDRISQGADNKLGPLEATTFISTTTLTMNLQKDLAVALNLIVSYDNAAIARRNAYTNYDVTTGATLIYKLF